MAVLIASDIHGSALYCEQLLDLMKKEKMEDLILLGDILYHGPRNDLPEGYAPKKVVAMLNPLKDHILCIHGNCDAEVDQMVLDFPVLADYALLEVEGRTIYASHGHVYHEDHLPPLKKGDVFIHGHTHLPRAEKREDYILLNPGSIAIPKGGNIQSYGILENGVFTIKGFSEEILLTLKL